MHKHLHIALIVAILIPSTALGYYYGIFLPKKAGEEMALNIAIRKENQEKQEECISEAKNAKDSVWERSCSDKGKSDCALSLDLAESIMKDFKEDRDICIKRFPSN